MEELQPVVIDKRILESGILTDPESWQLFSFLLLISTDGEIKTGRNFIGKALKVKPTTIYKRLKKLKKTWKMVTYLGNNRFTTIQIVNWPRYNSKNLKSNIVWSQQNVPNVTTNENIEASSLNSYSNNINNNNIYINNNNINNIKLLSYSYRGKGGVGGKVPFSSLEYLKEIPVSDIPFLMGGLDASEDQVRDKADDLYNYCIAKGRVYKNYRAFLRNALKRDFKKSTYHFIK